MLSAHGYFFHSPYSEFSSQPNPRFMTLRKTRFHNGFYIWIVTSLKSPQDSIYTIVSESFICSFVYTRTTQVSYSKRGIIYSTP